MTWKELRDKISRMTEEEQQQDVVIWGEDFPAKTDCMLVKNDENMYYNEDFSDDTCYPESELEEGDIENPATFLVLKKGAHYIYGE